MNAFCALMAWLVIAASAVAQRRRRVRAGVVRTGSRSDVSIPSKSEVSFLSFCESMTVAASL